MDTFVFKKITNEDDSTISEQRSFICTIGILIFYYNSKFIDEETGTNIIKNTPNVAKHSNQFL